MKLAIPTNDGIAIAQNFKLARGFFVCTFEFGTITCEEMRWNLLSEMLTTEEGYLYNLKDCDTVAIQTICEGSEKRLKSENKQVIKTEETLITNILLHYRDHELHHQSDLTCCP